MKTKYVQNEIKITNDKLRQLADLREGQTFSKEEEIAWHKLTSHYSFLLNNILHLSVNKKCHALFHIQFPDQK